MSLPVPKLSDEIQPYDSDHTALVHVLWDARIDGLSLDDADEIASRIMRSKWIKAVRLHVAASSTSRNQEGDDA
jgi:hypothetical protein